MLVSHSLPFALSGLGVWGIEWLDRQIRQKSGIRAHSFGGLSFSQARG